MKSGFAAGTIAGIIGGIASMLTQLLGPFIGLWLPLLPDYFADIDFLIFQFGSQLTINALWGAIIGIIYTMVYDRIPGKTVLKGLIFGLTIWFITNIYPHSFFAAFEGTSILALGIDWFTVGLFAFIAYGLTLGLLYKKPTEVPSIKKEKTRLFKIKNCKHCGASIPKGSKFCKECGKKQ